MRDGVLTYDPLEGEEAPVAAGPGRAVGAVVSFAGVVRADTVEGRVVTALRYEAYEPMAEREIAALERAAHARWNLAGIRVRHRLGTVRAGAAAVWVTVTAAHRGEAFAAAEFLMDGIKDRVPIWKQELYADGASAWVRCRHGAAAQEHRHALV